MRKLYHIDLGLPEGLEANLHKIGVVELEYGAHARRAARDDRYGIIKLPRLLDCSNARPIEVEVINNRVTKIVWRAKYNADFDILIVMTMTCFVKTVWLNSVRDLHSTLDETKYDRPEAP